MGTSRMMNRHGHDNAHVVKKIRTTVSTDKLESGVKLAQMLKGVSPCCFEYPVWLQARFAPVFVFGAAAVAWILSKCFDLNTLMCILLSGLDSLEVLRPQHAHVHLTQWLGCYYCAHRAH